MPSLRKKTIYWMLILSLIVAVASSSYLLYKKWMTEKVLGERLNRSVSFLFMQYDQSLNLCCEAPNLFPDRYWLVSDNLWAYKALESYYPHISQAIKMKLIELAEIYNLPRNEDGLPISYKHEAVIGDTVPRPFNCSVNYTLIETDHFTVKIDISNSTTVMEDWEEYADLFLYASLSLHNENNMTGALKLFNKAKVMWDGKGIIDKAFDGTYTTYKLALLLYVSRILNDPLPFKSELETILWEMQRESDGGIITNYNYTDNNIIRIGDANTETTSLTLIAYAYSQNEIGKTVLIFLIVTIAVIIILTALWFFRLECLIG